jgi:hypothetical protein
MPYPSSTDSLVDRPERALIRSQDPNDAYHALRDIRAKLGDLASLPSDLIDSAASGTLLIKRSGQWQAVPETDFRRDDDALWLGAESFAATSGSPTAAAQQGHPTWQFADASTQQITGEVHIPPTWLTVDLTVYWSNPGTGSGDVVWESLHQAWTAGDTLDFAGSAASVTVAAPNQDVVASFTRTGVAVTAGAPLGVMLRRLGGAANDSLANAASLLGVAVAKAS